MKFYKKIMITLLILIIFTGGYIITHLTPLTSIRTHIFVTGHPIGAFKGTIQINEGQYKLDKNVLDNENAMIYVIVGYNLYDGLGNIIPNYKVKKTRFLYFTEEYGEA